LFIVYLVHQNVNGPDDPDVQYFPLDSVDLITIVP